MRMINKFIVIMLFIISAVILLSLTTLIVSAAPCLGSQFKGTCQFVRNSGTVNCSVGISLVAYRISGTSHVGNGTETTLYSGAYGNKLDNGRPNLAVSGEDANVGDIINFTINTINSDQTDTFACGAAPTDLALTFTDTSLPSIVSVSRANNSYLNSTNTLIVSVSDNKGINNQTFNNGNGTNISFTNNTAFSPGFTTVGINTLLLDLTDRVGNIFTGTYNYSYDTTAPALVTISKSNNSYMNSTDQLTITLSDSISPISNASYKIGAAGAWIGFTNNTAFTPGFSTAGNNYIFLRINDSAGNVNDSLTYNFSYDTTAPALVTISKSNNSYMNSTDQLTITLSDSISPISNASYKIGAAGAWIGFSSNTAFTPGFSTAGNNYIFLRINDSAGNVNDSLTYNYSYDATAPALVTISKSNNSYMNSTDQLTITLSDSVSPLSNASYKIGAAGAWIGFTNNTAFTPGFSTAGNNYIFLRINDSAGNVNDSLTYNYSYDTTAPALVTISKSNNSYINNTDQLTITLSDSISSISNASYKIGAAGAWIGFTNNTAFTPGFSTAGNNYIFLRINDSAGNVNQSLTYNFSYDITTPHFIDVGPTATQQTTASSLHVILWTTINEVGNCTYGVGNNSFSVLTLMNTTNGLNHTANLTFTADNSSAIYYFKCNDTAGNINVDGNSTTFAVDVSYSDTSGNTGGGGGGGGSTPVTIPSAPVTVSPITSPSVPSSEGEGAEAGAAEGGAESGAPAGEGGEGAEAGAPSEAPVTAGEGEEEAVGLAGMAFKGLTGGLGKTTEVIGKAFSALSTKKGAKIFSIVIIILLIAFLGILIWKTKKK